MIEERYNNWLNSEKISNKDKRTLKKMNEKEKAEAFYDTLTFGTSGIRGIMGLGESKFNFYTLGRVNVGYAKYLNKNYKNPSVVVAYDTRLNSKEYAIDTCLILNYYGIKTYIFDEYTSTPELSFAIRFLKTSGGIVITSSHNSKEYNGYKVYNHLGSQIIGENEVKLIKEINDITDLNLIKKASLNNELYNIVNEGEKEAFINENKKVLINKKLIKKHSNNIKITYSSLHGVGIKPMTKLFDFYNLKYNIVKKQCKYDKNFKTAPYPNPEIIDNYNLAIKEAKKFDSDIIIMSDPDADRIGVMVKNDNDYKYLTGDMIGSLFAYYIIKSKEFNKDSYMVRSIPSSNFIDVLAKKYKFKIKEVLTGCKNIANEKLLDPEKYIFGYEESLGYVFNINVNDKNAFSSALFIIEILCYLKERNMSFIDYFDEIGEEIGYFYNYSVTKIYNGLDAKEKMNNIMNALRKNEIVIPNYKEKIDYLNNKKNNTNALKYIFNDNSILTIRPSGTENKIKLYFISNDRNKLKSKQNLENLKKIILPLFK